MMSLQVLYKEHIKERVQTYSKILSDLRYDGIVISSGTPYTYFADDQDAPFKPTPHFSHWTPYKGARSLIHFQPNKKPKLVQFKPRDFWYDQDSSSEEFWQDEFEMVVADCLENVWNEVKGLKKHAFIGPDTAQAEELGFDINPIKLRYRLDWERGQKSQYEIQNLLEANHIAAQGHQKARELFSFGGSELEIHQGFLKEVKFCEIDLPYPSIVGIDEKSAVLHYQYKRHPVKGTVMLIDAGVSVRSYASDITRTYCLHQAPETLKGLLKGMEELQQELCTMVQSDLCFSTLHEKCHRKISGLLNEFEIIKMKDSTEAIQKGITKVFFPHGLGHMIGIQVHDVSGLQKNELGDPCDKNALFPTLRTARNLREREVITIEPGLYFIKVLLDPHRSGELSTYFNWKIIDELLPYGGIRIEDNILVQKGGNKNLTREYLGTAPFPNG